MSRCDGFVREFGTFQTQENDQLLPDIPLQQKKLPCYPSSVIYGHTAARGLDINRWTIGLDSGCASDKELSALILGPHLSSHREEWEEDDQQVDIEGLSYLEEGGMEAVKRIKFGEYGQGNVVQVSCGE